MERGRRGGRGGRRGEKGGEERNNIHLFSASVITLSLTDCREYLATFKKTVAMHEVFLQRLASHPTLRNDHHYQVFLEFDGDVSQQKYLIKLVQLWSQLEQTLLLTLDLNDHIMFVRLSMTTNLTELTPTNRTPL